MIVGMSEDTTAAQTSSAPAGTPSKDECTMAMLIYILALLTGWLGPLILWLIKKDSSQFINYHGKEVLNFTITFFVAYIISWLLIFVFFIGCVLIAGLLICSLIFCIQGAMAANKGQMYRFPFAIRLIK